MYSLKRLIFRYDSLKVKILEFKFRDINSTDKRWKGVNYNGSKERSKNGILISLFKKYDGLIFIPLL